MSSSNQIIIPPFLKWAGGKRWLYPEVYRLFPKTFNRYIEPFLGGGSIFFYLQPYNSILSDLNAELIELYEVVRDTPDILLKLLLAHQSNHSKKHYYSVRAAIPEERCQRAARTLYLNRTCFNGLYRVNKHGQFNVPLGTKTTVVFPGEDFLNASKLLQRAALDVCDFEETLKKAVTGDLIYIDPPYTVAHNLNGFLKYNDNIFSWEDQIRLKKSCLDAADRGAYVFISNANHESIRDLYANNGTYIEVSRHSIIAGSSKKRRITSELLIKMDPRA